MLSHEYFRDLLKLLCKGITTVSIEKRMERLKNIIMILLLMSLAMYLTQ